MKRLILSLVLAVLIASCFKETINKAKLIKGVNWSGTYAVPAANIDIGLEDAISFANTLTNVGSIDNKIIYLAYEKTLKSLSGDQMIQLNNQNFNFSDKMNGTETSTLTGSGSVNVNRTFTATFVHSDEIDSVSYRSGNLGVNVTNTYSHAAAVSIAFPDITKNGQVVTLTGNVSANNSTVLNLDLKGCVMRLTAGGAGYNHFRCQATLNYTNSGSSITGSENFGVDVNITGQQFSRVWGYFGNNLMLQGTDSVSLSIFGSGSSIKSTNVSFADPRLKVYFNNTTGIPFKVNTKDVTGNKVGSPSAAVSGFPEDHNVAASTGPTLLDSTEKNSGNSNFKTIINNQPRYVAFTIKADANPAGKVQRNWLNFDSRFSVKVWVELPFNGWAGKIEMRDSSPLDLNLEGAEDYIDWITLRIEVDNGLPLDAEFQGFFADSSGKILDSVFIPARPFAIAAEIDANGNVVQATHDKYNITFERDRIKNILNTSQLIFTATMRSAKFNSGLVEVRLTTDQRFKIKLGVHTKLTANEKF